MILYFHIYKNTAMCIFYITLKYIILSGNEKLTSQGPWKSVSRWLQRLLGNRQPKSHDKVQYLLDIQGRCLGKSVNSAKEGNVPKSKMKI